MASDETAKTRSKKGQNGQKKPPNCTFVQLPKYVIETPDGWRVRRTFPTAERDEKGRIVYVQVVRKCEPRTEERAKEIAESIETMYRAAKIERDAPRPVADLVREFVEAKRIAVSPRTYEYYDWMYQTYIKGSSFGRTDAAEIKPRDVQAFYAATGASAKMVRKLHIFLSMALKQAVRWETIRRNPCEGLVLPRITRPEIDVMNADEAKAFMKVCMADFPVLALALDSWMRPGEYLALRHSDIDLGQHTASVEQSVAWRKGGGFYFKPPKTPQSKRTIELSPQICERLATIPRKKGTDLIFSTRKGTPIKFNNLGQREMVEACDRAGIRSFSLYSLRHTGATLSLSNGAHIKAVSERLGHSSIEITLSNYTHVLPAMKSETVARFAEMVY